MPLSGCAPSVPALGFSLAAFVLSQLPIPHFWILVSGF